MVVKETTSSVLVHIFVSIDAGLQRKVELYKVLRKTKHSLFNI